MPIECDADVEPVIEAAFKEMDYEIMSFIFAIHNDLGRLCDEKVYQKELVFHCERMGFESVLTELPIRVWHRDFEKILYVDLFINNGMPYEMKTVSTLTGGHRAQTLNYLLLLGLQHGKLVNMRARSVQHRFVSTSLTRKDRYEYSMNDKDWINMDAPVVDLRALVSGLVEDWGMFLSTSLYCDAIEHFLGGRERVVQRADLFDGDRMLGAQQMHFLAPDIAFHISGVSEGEEWYRKHLARLVQHTRLKALQWVNFDRHIITFRTIVPQ